MVHGDEGDKQQEEDVCAEMTSPKRQSKPDCGQFQCVFFHWVVEASHKSQPHLQREGTQSHSVLISVTN